MAIEQRIINTNASLRAVSQGDQLVLRGYAARYGVKSHPLPGGFTEQIAPGAFTRSLASGQDILCDYNHDSNFVLGRTKSGTLKVKDDPKVGLAFQCQLDKNQVAHRDLHSSVKRSDISDCSFSFIADPNDGDVFNDGTDENGQRTTVRTLRNVRLLGVSICAHPAYPNTSVDARSAAAQIAARTVKAERLAAVRSIAAKYPYASFEDIAIRMHVYGVNTAALEDALLQLRAATIARAIRQGFTGADFSPSSGCSNTGSRYQQGQANDPTASLRDDDDDFYKLLFGDDDTTDDDFDSDRHLRCAEYHRALARKASNWQQGAAQHSAANLHDEAARLYPDLAASQQARAASRKLKG